MIAPEVVVVERREILADGNHGRAGRVECQRLDLAARDTRVRQRQAHGFHQRLHVGRV
jgi:hypothetical protein